MPVNSILEVGSSDLVCDLLIVGSGPAGLAIAAEFLATDLSVVVLESGGMERTGEADALNAFESVGHPRAKHEAVGCRGFGGTSALWTGRCGQLDPIDFHARPWLPHSGWPLDPSGLAIYYQRAGYFLGLAPVRPVETAVRELRQPFDAPVPDVSRFKPVLWQYSTSLTDPRSEVRHFTPEGTSLTSVLQHTGAPQAVHAGLRTASALRESKTIKVFTDATVTEIRTDPVGGRVAGARATAPNGSKVDIKARYLVLACGGIQNPRLLLASRDQNPNGLGNDHDQVGRYLCDHTFSEIAVYKGAAGIGLRRRFSTRWHPSYKTSHVHNLGLRLSDELQRADGLLNAAIHTLEYGARLNALSTLARGVRRLKAGSVTEALQDVASAVSRPAGLVVGASDRFLARRPSLNLPERTVVGCVVEQELQPESRVSLSKRTDRHGQPIVKLDWRISEREYQTVRSVEEAFRTEVQQLGIDGHERPDWTRGGFEDWSKDLIDLAHPSCTTRMSSGPESGVVDANCQVHGVQGLFVAGSSVFASNSHMNPTHTVVALALRLADHIKSEIRGSVPAAARNPSTRPIRFGFVGGGHRVETVYAPVMAALADETSVCGVVTRSAEGAARIAERTHWPAGTDLQEMLKAGLPDALIVAVPDGEIASRYPELVDLGIPLLLETPFCWNEHLGRKLLKKIDGNGLLVAIAEQFPLKPEAQLLQKVIELGLIGRVETVVNDFAVWGYHGIGLLRALVGRERRPVRAQASHLSTGGDVHGLEGTVGFEDGSTVLYRFSTAQPNHGNPGPATVHVRGTRGSMTPAEMRFDCGLPGPMISPVLRHEAHGDLQSLTVATPDGEVKWVNPFFGQGLNDEQIAVACLVRSLSQAVRYNGSSPYPAWSALEDVELINALGYSADRKGAVVTLPASRLKQKVLKTLTR